MATAWSTTLTTKALTSMIHHPLLNEHSMQREIFPIDLDEDYLCKICHSVPKRPATTQCCGQINCFECLYKWLLLKPTCPICREPCLTTEILHSLFVSTRLGLMNVKCINHVNCSVTAALLFGKEGSRLMEHVLGCQYTLFTCPDCNKPMVRTELDAHKPLNDQKCRNIPLICTICDNMKITSAKWALHEQSKVHHSNILRKMMTLSASLLTSQVILEEVKSQSHIQTEKLIEMKSQQQETILLLADSKAIALKNTIQEALIQFDERHQCATIEVEVEIHNGTFLNICSKRVHKWGHDWRLKVEKDIQSQTDINLLLCCCTDDNNNNNSDGIFPFTVDYQLLVRKHYSDDAIELSQRIRNEFKLSSGHGLSKCTSLVELERLGVYTKILPSSIIVFGVCIYPISVPRKWCKTVPVMSSSAITPRI